MNRKSIVICILFVFLISCSTGYHAKSLTGGYKDQVISTDVTKITYTGNAYTTPAQTYQYAMRHAAELTLKSDQRYFEVLKNRTYNKTIHSQAANIQMAVTSPTTELTVKFVKSKTAKSYTANKVLAEISAR